MFADWGSCVLWPLSLSWFLRGLSPEQPPLVPCSNYHNSRRTGDWLSHLHRVIAQLKWCGIIRQFMFSCEEAALFIFSCKEVALEVCPNVSDSLSNLPRVIAQSEWCCISRQFIFNCDKIWALSGWRPLYWIFMQILHFLISNSGIGMDSLCSLGVPW